MAIAAADQDYERILPSEESTCELMGERSPLRVGSRSSALRLHLAHRVPS